MYEAFFGLSEKPFSIQPDPSFLYWGRGHRLAYAMLEYGVLNHAGISIITGEVGCGKTTLIHRLLEQLSDTHSVALLSNIQEGRGELLSWVLMGFGQPYAGKTHVELFAQLQGFFISEYAKGRRVVLIIDEAQNLSIDMLEELRMLSNINAGKDQLLQLILVGQPQLKDLLNRPDMLQLAQRVGSDFHLHPLTRDEVAEYVETRLAIAGAKERIFSPDAIDVIAEQSGGVPRVINIVADTALVYAFSAEQPEVNGDLVRAVIRDKVDYGVFGFASRHVQSAPQAELMRAPASIARLDPPAPRMREPLPMPTRLEKPADAPRMSAPRRGPRLVDAPDAPTEAPREMSTPPQSAPALSAASTQAPARAPSSPAIAQSAQRAETAPSIGVIMLAPDPSAAELWGDASVAHVIVCEPGGKSGPGKSDRAIVVEFQGAAANPGRARNAGYRQLKRARPDVKYVQFVDTGDALAPRWLHTGVRFLERRPEVAILEGRFESPSAAPERDAGETPFVDGTFLVRAEAFEAAGGYRGDLPVNETADLCIRLRRRGAHVWRIEEIMARRSRDARSLSEKWREAAARGYKFAHGARLHGAAPERLYIAEQYRALIWGAAVPFLLAFFTAAIAAAALWIANPLTAALAVAACAGFCALLYIARIVYVAVRDAGATDRPVAHAVGATCAHFPEFFGVWKFHAARVRRSKD